MNVPVVGFGIDGCRAGWIVAAAGDLDEEPTLRLARRFRDCLALVVRCRGTAGVDIPIGLSEAGRACDREARALLGAARAPSIFTPPCRAALAGRTAAEARALNLRATGRSLSAQALGIVPKIREVDELMAPELQRLVHEVHPEVTFASLSPARRGLAASKRTAEGRRARLALLPPAFARAACRPPRFRRGEVAPDDCVDALAALLTALRVLRGEGRRLPCDGVARDERGLRMEIHY